MTIANGRLRFNGEKKRRDESINIIDTWSPCLVLQMIQITPAIRKRKGERSSGSNRDILFVKTCPCLFLNHKVFFSKLALTSCSAKRSACSQVSTHTDYLCSYLAWTEMCGRRAENLIEKYCCKCPAVSAVRAGLPCTPMMATASACPVWGNPDSGGIWQALSSYACAAPVLTHWLIFYTLHKPIVVQFHCVIE